MKQYSPLEAISSNPTGLKLIVPAGKCTGLTWAREALLTAVREEDEDSPLLIVLVDALMAMGPAACDAAFEQLMDYAKKNPGLVTVGHSGAGGSWHLAIASLATATGVKFNYVPFDGSAPNRAALIGGHVDVATSGIDEMLQLYKAGQVRILAVNALKRHASFPDVPTIAEAGFPNSAPVMDWRGIATAKGVSPERMQVLVKGFKAMFNDPEFKKLAHELALPLVYKDPKEFNGFLGGMENSLKPALKDVGLLKQ